MKEFIKIDFRSLAVPFTIFIAVFLLTIVSVKIIFDNVTRLNTEINDNTKTNTMLQTKLTSLKQVESGISTQTQDLVLALPGSDSALNAIGQVKLQAHSLGLIINNLFSQTVPSLKISEINSTNIDIEGLGSYASIINFVVNISNSFPINRFMNLSIKNQTPGGDDFKLTATILTFWVPLPTKIPAITEPILTLTEDETNTLNQISSLKNANEAFTASPSGALGKTNPFQ